MTGRAVVTTRLSSAAMNSAIELIAKVHRTRWVGAGPDGLTGKLLGCSEWLLRTRWKKGGGLALDVSAAALQVLEQPGLGCRRRQVDRGAADLDGCRDVQEHPLGEEPVDLHRSRAGQLDHPLVEAAELGPDDLADVRVGARGICLELDEEGRAVDEETHVRGADRVEDRVAAFGLT